MSFLKVFVTGLYAAWAVKLGIIDSDTNLLFALPMVLLSIYGLWVIVRRGSDYLARAAEVKGDAGAVS